MTKWYSKKTHLLSFSPLEDNSIFSINHPLTNITLACAETSLEYFQHSKLHAHVSVVLSPSSQCENIGFFLGGGASIFLCWKCTYAGYVYPVADSFKFSREDETRLLTKAEYAQSMIPYGRLVYGQLSEEFCLLRRFHCRMAENCIGKLRGSTRVLTIRHLDEGAADVLPCKEKLSWEFTKSCCMHSNWFCWNGGFPWDLQWTSINGPRSSCKREVESLKRGVCYFASRCSHWK